MTKNYILGRGENLVRQIQAPKIEHKKAHPYEVGEARDRLLPKFQQTARKLDQLPERACPRGESVASFIIHPAYLAKSYYPREFLYEAKLRVLGSRIAYVKPTKVATKEKPKTKVTAEFLVASTRENFDDLPRFVRTLDLDSAAAERLRQFEDVRELTPESKLRNIPQTTDYPVLEIILHADEKPSSDYIIEGFRRFLREMSIKVNIDKRLYVGGLCFLPLKAPRKLLNEIAEFSFLRVARGMPKLRPPQIVRAIKPKLSLHPNAVPTDPPVDPALRVAVFDGGMGKNEIMNQYVSGWKGRNMGKPIADYEEHGHMVTGALLFGPIDNPKSLPLPFAKVDHYRILDEHTHPNDDELFDVIRRIESTVLNRKPEFMVLSVGPNLVIDDEPHVWTCKLDQLLSNGDLLAAVAVGNDGEADRNQNLHRVQVPSDCVNSLSVGACDSRNNTWERASYSSMGPGRSPGLVKPDVLAFGGCADEPFPVLSQQKSGEISLQYGTSFAAPFALRAAVGVRAYLGSIMKPLVLKALLINRSQANHQSLEEIGWGRINEDVESLITCADNEAVIIYQGALRPGNYWEAEIPWPDGAVRGNVEIVATFCYACQTDPEHPIHYTRTGLEVVFRPHSEKHNIGAKLPKSESLFGIVKPYATEQELRHDALKWETTIHGVTRKRASSVHRPHLQIHYNAREGGSAASAAGPVPYALVLTVRAKNVRNFYDRIMSKYRNQLEVLQPVVRVPVRGLGLR
ncbi:MAG: peptidase S8 and S53, subtilisin, kexin, sedolisin [Candidatus Abyssobacteria bacterium SURF_5]|uniref:Peptidase S8 and S53, subtilisin, kexin, sedolisin n=1 Tax=Abyssobacteria bacterium (strain SURF_5) TaxID=2093360 RepID=A0A3A4NUB8_ABYX5|nr:MAG: peptidase S8 and S53, subtilisin, kexin, sedolisin [Candidatus Abyssubacteria bacterium SURF_5]